MKVKMRANAKTQLIQGNVGNLEIRFHAPAQSENLPAGAREGACTQDGAGNLNGKGCELVVLSHPHPLYGGTMNNKVITTIEHAFQKLGFSTICYNFRGVGQSEGEYDEGIGEVQDLLKVVEWAKREKGYEKTHLAGFSFGSFVSLKALEHLQVESLLTVAPPVGIYDFSSIVFPEFAPSDTFRWSMIQGGKDEVICAKEALDWVRQTEFKPDIYWRESASHFFHGELIWLRKVVQLIY